MPASMSQNVALFEWTEARLLAAHLVAEGQLSDSEIAVEIGVNRRTVQRWKDHPEFTAKVAEYREALDMAILSKGIANRVRRVEALDSRWQGMKTVIAERGADDAMRDVPGGKTGLLTHDVKMIGGGEFGERVDVYEFDAALMKELREHEKQAAQELGQWEEKHVHGGEDGGPIVVKVLGASASLEDL